MYNQGKIAFLPLKFAKIAEIPQQKYPEITA
jgi:hypothetical protein